MSLETIRGDSIAVNYQTRKGLQYVARAKGMNSTDALADEVLWQWLEQSHPDVVAHLKQQQANDTTFKDALQKKLNQIPFA